MLSMLHISHPAEKERLVCSRLHALIRQLAPLESCNPQGQHYKSNMLTHFAVLLVLLLTTASADTSQNAAITETLCPDLPLSHGSPAIPADDTPCPPLTLPNLRSQDNSNGGAYGKYGTSPASQVVLSVAAPGEVHPASHASFSTVLQTESTSIESLVQVKKDLTVDLQETTTAQDVVSCTPVSVKGDATYCISGRVCSGVGSNLPGTNCPKRGDIAIASCLSTLKSYNDGGNNCVAVQDAQCVVIDTGVWGCAFPAIAQIPPAEQQIAAEADTSISAVLASIPPVVLPPIDGAKEAGDFAGYEADIAPTEYSGSAATASTFTANTASTATGIAGMNVAVAVAALVMAAVGVVAVRKRQNDRRLDRSRNNSIRNLSCMELSTPI